MKLRIAVLGAGAIGGYVAARLALGGQVDITVVGRERQREVFERGVRVQDFDGPITSVPPHRLRFVSSVAVLDNADIVLVSVKSGDTETVARELLASLPPETLVFSLQNGVRAASILKDTLGAQRVCASVVTFNVVIEEDLFRRTTSGPWMVEAKSEPRHRALIGAMRGAAIPTTEHQDLGAHQWTKLLVNLNNAVGALTDVPTSRLLDDAAYRRIVRSLVDEGRSVVTAAGLPLAPWNGVPLSVMSLVLALPSPIVRILTSRQVRVDEGARSSMWQDLAARRATEVDYLNGEIVRLASRVGHSAPRNRKIVSLIEAAVLKGEGSPALSADALQRELGG